MLTYSLLNTEYHFRELTEDDAKFFAQVSLLYPSNTDQPHSSWIYWNQLRSADTVLSLKRQKTECVMNSNF
jgi:hypothetical protein